MQKLIDGLRRFQNSVFCGQRELFEELAKGQSPEALFITCSDSRVNPNLLTQTGPGDLFIIRNAGNIVPRYDALGGGEEATIEYAIAALGVRDVIVCGHSHCGAMKALLEPPTIDVPSVSRWLRHAETTRRILDEEYQHLAGERLFRAAIEVNVLVQIESLLTHPTVASAIEEGRLRVHGWVYEIESGEVFAYERESNKFMEITKNVKSRPLAPGLQSFTPAGV